MQSFKCMKFVRCLSQLLLLIQNLDIQQKQYKDNLSLKTSLTESKQCLH